MSQTYVNISFTDILINGKTITEANKEAKNECKVIQNGEKHNISFIISSKILLEVDIEESLAVYNYSIWLAELESDLIMDFKFILTSIPPELSDYLSTTAGCQQHLRLTLKSNERRKTYQKFNDYLRSKISTSMSRCMDRDESLNLWKEQCVPIPTKTLKCIDFTIPRFPSFSASDVNRLKNHKKWLSDSHITFCLQDFFRDFHDQNLFGDLKIELLDTIFWSQFSREPEKFVERTRNKLNILKCDYILMPMFESDHWRLGIIEKPGEFLKGNTIFHILDSLPNNYPAKKEARLLQMIFLQHFEGVKYEEGRIKVNLAKVPLQPNSKDCGCFLIYFAKKFLSHPHSTLAIIKMPFLSNEDRISSWGLKSADLTFIRLHIRTRLFEYIKRGEASIKFH